MWKKTNGDRNYLKQQKSIEFMLFELQFSSSDKEYILPRLHVLLAAGTRLNYHLYGIGVPFQQIDLKISPNFAVMGTLSITIGHHNSNSLLSALLSTLALLCFPHWPYAQLSGSVVMCRCWLPQRLYGPHTSKRWEAPQGNIVGENIVFTQFMFELAPTLVKLKWNIAI